jgi:hypothetical protein
MLASARKSLEAVAALGYTGHAYARVDGVVIDGDFKLMELEMIEPALFLTPRLDAAELFAAKLEKRLA